METTFAIWAAASPLLAGLMIVSWSKVRAARALAPVRVRARR